MKIPQLTEDNNAIPVAVRLNAKHRETYKKLGGVKWLRYVLDLADKELMQPNELQGDNTCPEK